MTGSLPSSIQNLISHFSKLPGIGPKSAYRMAFYVINQNKVEVERFSDALINVRTRIKFCSKCNNYTEEDVCDICIDEKRTNVSLMVVEDILDLLAFENTKSFKGRYHIIGGAISPIKGIGPEDLFIKSLVQRFKEESGTLKEIIIATSPNLEGEATAMYIKQEAENFPHLRVTRIARGVPTGADLDYTDQVTLSRSLEGRVDL